MRKILLLFLSVLLLSGCRSEQWCQKHYPPSSSSKIVTQHDTIVCVKDSLIPLPADSGLIRALLECQGSKVVIKEILDARPGRKVVPFIDLKNNILTTGAKVDSSAVYFAWKERHIKESMKETRTIEKVVIQTTFIQDVLIWSGRITWVLISVFTCSVAIKTFIRRGI